MLKQPDVKDVIETIKVSKKWCELCANYLAKRPYNEVFEILQGLQEYFRAAIEAERIKLDDAPKA